MAGYNSDGVFTASICEKVLSSLASYTQPQNLPSAKRSYLGYLDALLSPLNKGGTEIIPVQTGDKHKVVRIKYQQRIVDSQVTTSEDGNCTTSTYDDFLETNFDVNKVASIEWGLSKREVTLICDEGNQDMINNGILLRFDALARKVNQTLLDTQTLNFGYNYGNSPASASTKSINVLVGATGAPLASGLQTLIQDYNEKNQYQGMPIVVGGGNIMKYFITLGAGCCNQDGVDMLSLSSKLGASMFLDTMAESTLGTNQFLVLAPGMLQFVPYNRYVGENAGQFGTSVDTTITDPRTGLTYDMKVDYDGCNEKFYIRLTLNYGLWIPPVDVFNAGDPLYRTNGSLRYTAATT